MINNYEKIKFSKDTKTCVSINCVKFAAKRFLICEVTSLKDDLSERSLQNRFIRHFDPFISNKQTILLDAEYNRNMCSAKSTKREPNPNFDLILHEPHSNRNNIIHWEFKKSNLKNIDLGRIIEDYDKDNEHLKDTTNPVESVRTRENTGKVLSQYSLGVFSCFFPKNPDHVFLQFYENGEVISDESGLFKLDCNENLTLLQKIEIQK